MEAGAVEAGAVEAGAPSAPPASSLASLASLASFDSFGFRPNEKVRFGLLSHDVPGAPESPLLREPSAPEPLLPLGQERVLLCSEASRRSGSRGHESLLSSTFAPPSALADSPAAERAG